MVVGLLVQGSKESKKKITNKEIINYDSTLASWMSESIMILDLWNIGACILNPDVTLLKNISWVI